MRYLGPLRILQTHKTIRTRTVSKPGISPTTLTNGCTLRHAKLDAKPKRQLQ